MLDIAEAGLPLRRARLRLSAVFWRRPWLKALALLLLPLLAFVIVYLGALTALFVSAFWQVNDFTAKVEHIWTFANFSTLIHQSVYRRIALRTIGIASAVTLTDAVLAFPLAYFMARVAGGKMRARVIVPRLLPGLVAGSIFTFSLTLGDFITPLLVGGSSSSFIGNVVEDKVGQPDIPFAAAFATVPVLVMGIYLVIARRLGAFEAV